MHDQNVVFPAFLYDFLALRFVFYIRITICINQRLFFFVLVINFTIHFLFIALGTGILETICTAYMFCCTLYNEKYCWSLNNCRCCIGETTVWYTSVWGTNISTATNELTTSAFFFRIQLWIFCSLICW